MPVLKPVYIEKNAEESTPVPTANILCVYLHLKNFLWVAQFTGFWTVLFRGNGDCKSLIEIKSQLEFEGHRSRWIILKAFAKKYISRATEYLRYLKDLHGQLVRTLRERWYNFTSRRPEFEASVFVSPKTKFWFCFKWPNSLLIAPLKWVVCSCVARISLMFFVSSKGSLKTK